jgi:hypothetical protein
MRLVELVGTSSPQFGWIHTRSKCASRTEVGEKTEGHFAHENR